MSGQVWREFGTVSVQQKDLWWVWNSLEWGLGSECAAGRFELDVGQFGVGLG